MSHETNSHDGHAHGHVIVSLFTLRTILALLLFFTLLTVGMAQFEVWIMSYFNITLPGWVNIVGAMIIATIKVVLVMAYFMQLRYESPLNTIVMLFTVLCVGLFLLFTSLDLLTRNRVYADKATIVIPGGSGDGTSSLTTLAKKKWEEKWGAEKFKSLKSVVKHAHHGHEEHAGSTGNRSRKVTGATEALTTSVSNKDAHGGGHAAPHAGDGHDAKTETQPGAH